MKLTTVSNSMLQHRFQNLHLAHLWFPLCAVLCVTVPAQADGLLNNGHIHGPHTDLLLNAQQISTLKNLRDLKKIALSPEQKAILCKKFPYANQVSTLTIYAPTFNTCTCEIRNAAVKVKSNKIEIADDWLAREFESPFDGEIQDKSQHWLEEQHLAKNPQDLQLLKQAHEEQRAGQDEKAIKLMGTVLDRNPNVPIARIFMIRSLNQLGSDNNRPGQYRIAVEYYKKSLQYIDKTRPKQIWLQQQKIKEVERLASNSPKS